ARGVWAVLAPFRLQQQDRLAETHNLCERCPYDNYKAGGLEMKFFLVATALSAICAALVPQGAAAGPQIGTSTLGSKLSAVPSAYLAGYQITEPGISRASVTFIVPTVTCLTSDTQGTAEGIGNEATPGSPTLLGI